jgi:hypothetical protein
MGRVFSVVQRNEIGNIVGRMAMKVVYSDLHCLQLEHEFEVIRKLPYVVDRFIMGVVPDSFHLGEIPRPP